MPREPVEQGEIEEGGAFELLRDLESKRITGCLRFDALDGSASGEITLFGGELAVEQVPGEDGEDPVEQLLSVGALRYRVEQRLPPMAVSQGNDFSKRGSLAVHVPADLMNYCEHAGLTGVLELKHEDHKAEAFYDGGELLAIELDGDDATDLQEVFAWEQGRFRITLDSNAVKRFVEDEPMVEDASWTGESSAPARGENTQKFLRVVEMALSDVVAKSEKARSPTRTSPPLPAPPKKRPRPSSVPPPERRRDEQTVKLIYLSGDAPGIDVDTSTRHVGKARAEPALFEASPERRAPLPAGEPAQESKSMAKKRKKKRKPAASEPAAKTEPKKASAVSGKTATASEPKPEPAKTQAKTKARTKTQAESAPRAGEAPPDLATVGRNLGIASAWALGVMVLGLLILAALAQLPPVV